jgi:hypothetical protein
VKVWAASLAPIWSCSPSLLSLWSRRYRGIYWSHVVLTSSNLGHNVSRHFLGLQRCRNRRRIKLPYHLRVRCLTDCTQTLSKKVPFSLCYWYRTASLSPRKRLQHCMRCLRRFELMLSLEKTSRKSLHPPCQSPVELIFRCNRLYRLSFCPLYSICSRPAV